MLQPAAYELRQNHNLSEFEPFLLIRLLMRRFTSLEAPLETQVRGLAIAQLETLSEALLDFRQPADLVAWLNQTLQG